MTNGSVTVLPAPPPVHAVATKGEPVLLLPVRLETRFEGKTLLIRIYPDEAHLDRRPGSDGRPQTRPLLLPDCFAAAGWRGGQRRFLVQGSAVDHEGLRLTPDLSRAAPDEPMRWLFDFAAAQAKGLALKVVLDEPALDRLLVFGLRGSLTGDAGAVALADLLAAHRATDGLFVVSPEAATNLVGSQAKTPAPAVGPAADQAGARLAFGLGLGDTAAHDLPGAADADETAARAMNDVVWPATLGYFLANAMSGGQTDVQRPTQALLDAAHAHFSAYVRPCGPYPTVRVGDQPYGLLPVTCLDLWKPHASDLAGAVPLLARLRPLWQQAAARLLRPRGDGDEILEVLRTEPSAQGFAARPMLGPLFQANLHLFLGDPALPAWLAARAQLGGKALKSAGLDGSVAQAQALFAPQAFDLAVALAETPAEVPAQTAGPILDRPINYLAWLHDATPAQLRQQKSTPRAALAQVRAPRDSLLYVVLRHATLLAHQDAAFRVLQRTGATLASLREPELVGFADAPAGRATVWSLFEHPVAAVTGTTPLGTWIRSTATPETVALRGHLGSLTALSGQPGAVLERHLCGALDACAYRLDAWITSLATRRLAWLRGRDRTGIRLGAYSWVENLRPLAAARASDGYLTAPSLAQATAAAILRNGYRARRTTAADADPLAVDLTSARVRTAAWILEGVRAGQPLGGLLGARFERALHDAGLDRFVATFRTRAPAAEGGLVDGMALLDEWRRDHELGGSFPWDGQRTRLQAELEALDGTVDAIADLTLAEGVLQAVRGSPERASAVFDGLSRGEQPPPEMTVAKTPRSSLSHSVGLLVLLGAQESGSATGWSAPEALRAQAAPRLEAWAAQLLGAAAEVRYRASWRAADGTTYAAVEVPLTALGLSALDFIYLSAREGALEPWALTIVSASGDGGSRLRRCRGLTGGHPIGIPRWPGRPQGDGWLIPRAAGFAPALDKPG